MDRGNAQTYDARKSVSSTYGVGLKEAFAISRDPLPARFEELLVQLQKVEDETLQSKHPSTSHGDF
jgi:hypothetical protein